MSRQKQSYILVTLALGVLMGALDMSIVSPAFTTLQQTFRVTSNTIIWVLTTYTLVYVISQPLTAKISDLYGRMWVYVSCVGLFGLGSLICGSSYSLPVFLLGRAVQAAGAGGVLPVASAVVGDTFPQERRGMALGIIGSLFGVAAVLGPNVGGWLTAGHSLFGFITSWREIFFLNLPLALVVMILASRFEVRKKTMVAPFDWRGAGVLSLALFLLVYGLTQLNFREIFSSITSWPAGVCVFLALVLFVLFFFLEKRETAPLLDVRLFARRQIVIVSFLSIAAGVSIVSIFFVPVLAQYVLGYRPDQAGSMVTVAAFMLFIATPLVGILIDRIGAKLIVIVGASLSTIALYLLSVVPPEAFWMFIIALSIVGLGLASFLGTPIRYITINEAPPAQRASSLAILSIFNSLGQTIGVPLAGSMIASQTSAIVGLQQFYFFASIVLATTIILGFFLKSRKQEIATGEVVEHQSLVLEKKA
jgi:EmrB/QacA subfamily drug resistance transporter